MEAPVKHNDPLFRALAALSATIDSDIRTGAMFGCPAIYVDRKLAACIYGDEIGLKIPADQAEGAIAIGRATRFTPYGKQNMRQWIALATQSDKIEEIGDLLRLALIYARSKG